MGYDITSVDPEKLADISQSAYYKKLQQELKDRTTTQQNQERDRTIDGEDKKEPPLAVEDVAKSMAIEDTVNVRSYTWKDDKSGTGLQMASRSAPVTSSVDLAHDGSAILRILGKKIDLTSQANRLRQQYMSSVIQGKSHNAFLGKYAQFKVGIYGQLLTFLGSSPSELLFLHKRAIDNGIKENQAAMAETVYHIELSELFHGKNKKTKRAMMRYREVQRQLIAQMNNFGHTGYWTQPRLVEEELTQCKRIQEELSQEQTLLKYQADFYRQEV